MNRFIVTIHGAPLSAKTNFRASPILSPPFLSLYNSAVISSSKTSCPGNLHFISTWEIFAEGSSISTERAWCHCRKSLRVTQPINSREVFAFYCLRFQIDGERSFSLDGKKVGWRAGRIPGSSIRADCRH